MLVRMLFYCSCPTILYESTDVSRRPYMSAECFLSRLTANPDHEDKFAFPSMSVLSAVKGFSSCWEPSGGLGV